MKDGVTDVERWGVKEGRELESEQAILSPDLETLLLINVNMHLTLGVEKLPA